MNPARRCSRTACGRSATSTLTYVYADQTAVLGPLATFAEPHAYDLCDHHAQGLSAPRGWEVLRLARDPAASGPTEDDLLALADAVREAARPQPEAPGPVGAVEDRAEPPPAPQHPSQQSRRTGGRPSHLRVLTSD